MQEALDFKISDELLKLLEDEYNEQQGDIATPKIEIESLKIAADQIPFLRNTQTLPLTVRGGFKAHVQLVNVRQKNRNEAVNRMIREEIGRRSHRNECYVMQAEGDFGNSFSSQISKNDNLDVSGFDQDKSMLREPRTQKPLISTKIDLTRRKTVAVKRAAREKVEI